MLLHTEALSELIRRRDSLHSTLQQDQERLASDVPFSSQTAYNTFVQRARDGVTVLEGILGELKRRNLPTDITAEQAKQLQP